MTRDEASKELRRVSRIVFAVERSFRLLQRLSPASYFSDPRATEIYMGCWLIAGIALGFMCYLMSGVYPAWLVCLLFIVSGLRVTDITQAVVNIGVFDHLGQTGGQEVANVLRSLVLLVANYIELFFWFGLVYVPLSLKNASGISDAFYFSAVTQLTVGYGDITPTGAARAIAAVQAALGWLLSLLVIARFVAFLPNIRENKASDDRAK